MARTLFGSRIVFSRDLYFSKLLTWTLSVFCFTVSMGLRKRPKVRWKKK